MRTAAGPNGGGGNECCDRRADGRAAGTGAASRGGGGGGEGGHREDQGVVRGGHIFFGRQRLDPAPPSQAYWVDLSGNTGYPGTSVCGVAVADHGNDLFVRTVTTSGALYETSCNEAGGMPANLVCNNAWVPILPTLSPTATITGLRAPEDVRPRPVA
ncbi:hypothetical protein [Kitasatospora sp. NPDC059571]|uniref:hypothetical protein n=1 Tax=Kitasatospora sp. NPDC059571 TaxID=3346871 RepID=UPI0036840AAD